MTDFNSPEACQERKRIVNMLRHLCYFNELGHSARHTHQDTNSNGRESLICDRVDLMRTMPLLTAEQKEVISLIGDEGYDELEVATKLGITQPAVSQRLRNAARKIQKIWHGR